MGNEDLNKEGRKQKGEEKNWESAEMKAMCGRFGTGKGEKQSLDGDSWGRVFTAILI